MSTSATSYFNDDFNSPLKDLAVEFNDLSVKEVVKNLVVNILPSASPTFSYRLKGEDTLTIGDQFDWIQFRALSLPLEQLSDKEDVESSIAEYKTFSEFLRSRQAFKLLEEIAYAGKRQRFTTIAKAIDWANFQPDELLNIIDLALNLGLSSLAIELAQQGAGLFPEHERIQRAAQVLSPPVVRTMDAPRANNLGSSRTWLRDHADQYRGQWIAVREGKLLGKAGSLKELKAIIGKDSIHTIITKVL